LIELRSEALADPARQLYLIPKNTSRLKLYEPVALVLLTAAIFIGAAFSPPALLDDADSTHAEVAREMAQTGDWAALKMDGIHYYEKDPLMYWMVAACFDVLGPTELAGRLPIAFSVILAVLGVWALGGKMFGGRAGFYGGLALATSVGSFLFTRILIPDMMIAGLLTWALFFFVSGLESENSESRLYLGFYAAAGLAFLAKGMIGAVFPFTIVFLFLLVTRQIRVLARMRLAAGLAVFVAIALPWSLISALRNPGFLWFHYVNEQVYRYLGRRYPKDYDTVPLPIFYALHLLWIFPWVAFLPSAITYIPRRLSELDRGQKMTMLVMLWILVIVGFFSFSTRQEYYTLPALPALAILCGRVLFDLEQKLNPDSEKIECGAPRSNPARLASRYHAETSCESPPSQIRRDTPRLRREIAWFLSRRRAAQRSRGEERLGRRLYPGVTASLPDSRTILESGFRTSGASDEAEDRQERWFFGAAMSGQRILLGIGLASLAASIVVLLVIRGVSLNGDISSALTRNPQYYALSLGHIFDLTPASFAALRAPVLGAGLALGLGTLISFLCFRRKAIMASAAALVMMMGALFFYAHSSMRVFEPYLSSKPLADDILRELKPGELIVVNGLYESASTLNFYTHEPLYVLNHRNGNLWFGSYLADAPPRFFDDKGFRDAWKGENRIYLDTDSSEVDSMKQLLAPLPVYGFARAGNKVILSNCP